MLVSEYLLAGWLGLAGRANRLLTNIEIDTYPQYYSSGGAMVVPRKVAEPLGTLSVDAPRQKLLALSDRAGAPSNPSSGAPLSILKQDIEQQRNPD